MYSSHLLHSFSSVRSLSHAWLFVTPWRQHARPPCRSPTPRAYSNLCPLSQWCHPTISISVTPFSSCPQFFPVSGFFSNESALCIRWPKHWSFSFSISTSNEYSGLISFEIHLFYLLAVLGTLRVSPTPWFKSTNSSVLSLLYDPTPTSIHGYWQTIALTIWTLVGKVMSLLFNMLSRLS